MCIDGAYTYNGHIFLESTCICTYLILYIFCSMSKYSENEDDPEIYESSGDEWKQEDEVTALSF